MTSSIADDVARVGRIPSVPTILEVVLRTTVMRFAAVARVTDTKWVACAVRDETAFGLPAGGELVLEVSNGGAPIGEQSLARLFHSFARSASDTPRPGLGLGLYIAAEIARAHGGTLDATSSVEDGTRFTFRMPAVG